MVGRRRGQLVALLAAIGLAGLLLSGCGSPPGALTKKSMAGAGQVIAEELIQQLGKGTSIVLVKSGKLDRLATAEVRGFLKTLRRQRVTVLAEVTGELDPVSHRWQLTPAQWQVLTQRYPAARAIVLFAVNPQPLAALTEPLPAGQPQLIPVAVNPADVQRLLEAGVVQWAIVYHHQPEGGPEPQTPRAMFDRQYQVVRAAPPQP